MAAGIGIVAQQGKGYTVKITDPFLEVCRAHGINDPIPEFSGKLEKPSLRGEGQSTLKKWVCGCSPRVNIRVGLVKREINIRCEDCGIKFELAE